VTVDVWTIIYETADFIFVTIVRHSDTVPFAASAYVPKRGTIEPCNMT